MATLTPATNAHLLQPAERFAIGRDADNPSPIGTNEIDDLLDRPVAGNLQENFGSAGDGPLR